uniref:Peflin-like isoform X1 n=1 Tax=Diabrotica virgifera virgifera TaxID=50390 RepID=A0A6P7H6G3_DIAVI
MSEQSSLKANYSSNSCDSLNIEDRIKITQSYPTTRKSSEDYFDSHDLELHHLLEQRERLKRKLLEKPEYIDYRELMNQRETERQRLLKNSNKAQDKWMISGLPECLRDKKIYQWYKPPPLTVARTETIHPAVEKWFRAMDMKNEGRISSKELQQAFEIFQGKKFSDAACKFVVRLFDLDKNGGLDIKEFETLYYHIKLWVNAFNTYDRGNSGFLGEPELDYALKHMDIHFSPDFIRFLITRNNPEAKTMSLDQYIVTCIQIQKFTDEFKRRDPNYTGNINIKYEDFLELILRCL